MDTPVRDYLNEGPMMGASYLYGVANISPTASVLDLDALRSFLTTLTDQHNQLMQQHARLQSRFDALVEVVEFMAISYSNLVPRMKAHRHAVERIEASRLQNPNTTSKP